MRYVYDGMRVIQERDASNVPTVSYTRGSDLSGTLEGAGGIGGMLSRSAGYSSGTGNWSVHYCYHADGNGNITYLVSPSQTLGASYRYDPYGNTISSSGGLASANTYRFSSKEFHVNSGLYYYGYRFYAPNLQRWLNRDPIMEKGGLNLYAFVQNNPLSRSDPFGLLWHNGKFPPWMLNPIPEPATCGNRIKNEVWNKYGWDENKKPRPDHRPGDNNFHYGHCVAHCRITRECAGGRAASWVGGILKEAWDELKSWVGSDPGWETGDLDANHEGRNRGRNCPQQSCEEACKGMEG